MANKFLKCLWGIVKTVLLALYLFILYELVIVPAILDWSTFGVVLVLIMTGLLLWSVPAGQRRQTAALAAVFLLSVKALNNVSEYSSVKFVLAVLFIFIFLLVITKILGRTSVRRFSTFFLVALLLGTSLDLSEVRFWPEFTVKWESPLLYKKNATVDYFSTALADVNGDGTEEIITQQNIPEALKEQKERINDGIKQSILGTENNRFAVYSWEGSKFIELPPAKYSLDKLKAAIPVDYLGYPFYETALITKANEIEQQMKPLLDRAGLVEQVTSFGSLPFQMLALDQKSLATKLKSYDKSGIPLVSPAQAAGELKSGPPPETVTLQKALRVWESAYGTKEIAEITPEQIPDLGTSEIILGDVDQDKTEEILLTSASSRILKLRDDGRWQILWVSPEASSEKFRFQGFRFEDFTSLAKDKTPQVIALSKSNVRESPTRYMTGYSYEKGALKQKWRVFSGLINLQAGDVDGDGQNELTGYMYRQQRIYVLEKHSIPVVPLLYLITSGLIILGFSRQLRNRKNKTGGEKHA